MKKDVYKTLILPALLSTRVRNFDYKPGMYAEQQKKSSQNRE